MKRRILSALTSIVLVTLVVLALIFAPFDAVSDSEADRHGSNYNTEPDFSITAPQIDGQSATGAVEAV